MNDYFVSVVLKVSAETPEQAKDYAFNDLNGISDDVLSLYEIVEEREADKALIAE